MKKDLLADFRFLVKNFMDNFDQVCYPSPEKTPPEIAILRHDLIEEEIREYMSAPPDSEEELDAICDILYVTLGTNLALSIPLNPDVMIAYRSDGKLPLYDLSKECLQDLACKFPCLKTQKRALNRISYNVVYDAEIKGYGLPGAFREVHRTNMTKLWPEPPIKAPEGWSWKKKVDGYLVKNGQGKVIKSPDFKLPNLKPFMPII